MMYYTEAQGSTSSSRQQLLIEIYLDLRNVKDNETTLEKKSTYGGLERYYNNQKLDPKYLDDSWYLENGELKKINSEYFKNFELDKNDTSEKIIINSEKSEINKKVVLNAEESYPILSNSFPANKTKFYRTIGETFDEIEVDTNKNNLKNIIESLPSGKTLIISGDNSSTSNFTKKEYVLSENTTIPKGTTIILSSTSNAYLSYDNSVKRGDLYLKEKQLGYLPSINGTEKTVPIKLKKIKSESKNDRKKYDDKSIYSTNSLIIEEGVTLKNEGTLIVSSCVGRNNGNNGNNLSSSILGPFASINVKKNGKLINNGNLECNGLIFGDGELISNNKTKARMSVS